MQLAWLLCGVDSQPEIRAFKSYLLADALPCTQVHDASIHCRKLDRTSSPTTGTLRNMHLKPTRL